jgi:hypothetical protein
MGPWGPAIWFMYWYGCIHMCRPVVGFRLLLVLLQLSPNTSYDLYMLGKEESTFLRFQLFKILAAHLGTVPEPVSSAPVKKMLQPGRARKVLRGRGQPRCGTWRVPAIRQVVSSTATCTHSVSGPLVGGSERQPNCSGISCFLNFACS